ncbi:MULTISPECIES: hypothetical protein [unclassified Bosea (in: a-proteobacteria)]|uniref:hypothetical protein n=1 Tax=unclassified Bosea (in: a-proteobacteria) TaxID=2653178 RepID=UPI000F7E5281|nr:MULTISPECIES: hypothetical protein [unclassified Bosea (in: a-proteobacteria)]
MRKLKQATQRAKARRELKEKKERAETGQVDRQLLKAAKTNVRNGHSTPSGRAASAGRSQKTTLH